ncbi:uncharacterized protein LOC132607956 [Lycium barbarum]|uniref:uncharacterized protein LOC132607956 n=1 Tax=Lycium barbarum TaxID=112863 RepID=UPI00293EE2AF|nr:uncharacterized protein LOC132607956 [Lycium barbarum]
MGNCLRHDLESVAPVTGLDAEKERLLWINTSNTNNFSSFSSSSLNSKRGMKIRITKKELEEMVGKVDMQMKGVTVDQVLSAMLINSREEGFDHRIQRQQYSWRPVLQRIPEVY